MLYPLVGTGKNILLNYATRSCIVLSPACIITNECVIHKIVRDQKASTQDILHVEVAKDHPQELLEQIDAVQSSPRQGKITLVQRICTKNQNLRLGQTMQTRTKLN